MKASNTTSHNTENAFSAVDSLTIAKGSRACNVTFGGLRSATMMCFTTGSACQLVLLWHVAKQYLNSTVPARLHRCQCTTLTGSRA